MLACLFYPTGLGLGLGFFEEDLDLDLTVAGLVTSLAIKPKHYRRWVLEYKVRPTLNTLFKWPVCSQRGRRRLRAVEYGAYHLLLRMLVST